MINTPLKTSMVSAELKYVFGEYHMKFQHFKSLKITRAVKVIKCFEFIYCSPKTYSILPYIGFWSMTRQISDRFWLMTRQMRGRIRLMTRQISGIVDCPLLLNISKKSGFIRNKTGFSENCTNNQENASRQEQIIIF